MSRADLHPSVKVVFELTIIDEGDLANPARGPQVLSVVKLMMPDEARLLVNMEPGRLASFVSKMMYEMTIKVWEEANWKPKGIA